MEALDNPKTWIPYMNSKECAKQICTLSCPQWCYLIFPPPPPFAFPDDKSQNNTTLSPLVIAIIGSLASAFLLVSYYAIISKYCGRSSRRVGNQPRNEETEEDFNEFSQHEPWFISTHGLDEALIRNITLVKYKNGDGLIGSIECSVCLGEFQEDDHLRLLPKCSHAFHVACIDTWLRSHSNCPLCRANIVSIFAQPPPILVVDEANDSHNQAQDHESLLENHVTNEETSTSRDRSGNLLTRHFRNYSDQAGFASNDRGTENVMRRSISMDHLHETSVSISAMLKLIHGKDCQAENWHIDEQPVKMAVGENSMSGFGNSSTSSNDRDGVNSVPLKRSFSSCRFLFSKHGKGSNATIPL